MVVELNPVRQDHVIIIQAKEMYYTYLGPKILNELIQTLEIEVQNVIVVKVLKKKKQNIIQLYYIKLQKMQVIKNKCLL